MKEHIEPPRNERYLFYLGGNREVAKFNAMENIKDNMFETLLLGDNINTHTWGGRVK